MSRLLIAIAVALRLVIYIPSAFGSPLATPSETPTPMSTQPTSGTESQVPEPMLVLVLEAAAKLASVPRGQLVVVRAEAVVWNDGSLGCPEPGMEYTQALVNGYWVVIEAAGHTYDFRAGRDGKFHLCPEGRGRPPSQSDNR